MAKYQKLLMDQDDEQNMDQDDEQNMDQDDEQNMDQDDDRVRTRTMIRTITG